MKIAIVRGDFAAPGEFPNFLPLANSNSLTLFTGHFPVWDINNHQKIQVEKLLSPVDLNFGNISRFRMAILNRLFTDAHVLFGLEDKLKGYDIAHTADTYYNFTQQCIAAKEKGYVKAVVSTVWENLAYNNEGISGRKQFKKRAFEKIDKFLAVTNSARNSLIQEGCNPGKIEVLMPGVDLKSFKRKKGNFKFPKTFENKTKLLFSARLVKEKGIIELLSLYKELKEIHNSVCFIIAGEGPLRESLSKQIEANGIRDVCLLGKIPYTEMPELYASCSLLLHFPVGSKTWQEQYGMSLIEAMACGLPILGLDTGSVREVIGDGGVVADSKEYYHQLQLMIKSNKLSRLSHQAEKYAKQKYDSIKYAMNLQRIYSDLL